MSKAPASTLFGKRVLITRPAQQSEDFTEAIRQAGAEPIVAPVIEFAEPDDLERAYAVLLELDAFAWVVFTAVTGVDAAFRRLTERGLDARAFGRAHTAAIGPATAKALRAHGIQADLVPKTYDGETLAEALIDATEAGDHVLLYRAQVARDVAVERLQRANRWVEDVAAYATRATHDPQLATQALRSDVWTFTSVSTVRAFAHNVANAAALQGERIVACIGPVTAEAARDEGFRVDVVAEKFTTEGLLRALLRPHSPA